VDVHVTRVPYAAGEFVKSQHLPPSCSLHSSTDHQAAASFKMASGAIKYTCGTLRILAVCLEYAGEIIPFAR